MLDLENFCSLWMSFFWRYCYKGINNPRQIWVYGCSSKFWTVSFWCCLMWTGKFLWWVFGVSRNEFILFGLWKVLKLLYISLYKCNYFDRFSVKKVNANYKHNLTIDNPTFCQRRAAMFRDFQWICQYPKTYESSPHKMGYFEGSNPSIGGSLQIPKVNFNSIQPKTINWRITPL